MKYVVINERTEDRSQFDTLREARQFTRTERLRDYEISEIDDDGELGRRIEHASLSPHDFENDAVEDSPCLPEPWWSYR